jgi:hypothetical protein
MKSSAPHSTQKKRQGFVQILAANGKHLIHTAIYFVGAIDTIWCFIAQPLAWYTIPGGSASEFTLGTFWYTVIQLTALEGTIDALTRIKYSLFWPTKT